MKKEEIYRQMDRWVHFPTNWDSYGGIAPTQENVDFAKKFIEDFPLEPYFCAPGPNGEIYIEYEKDGKFSEIYINDPTDIELLNIVRTSTKLEDRFVYEDKFSMEIIKEFLQL